MTDSSSPDDEPGQGRVPTPPPPAPIRPPPAVMARLLSFTPVPVRYRRDGWTPARQRVFIAALAESGCVLAACRRVGKSAEAAYRLARRPDAAAFRAAWEAALRLARWSRAINFRHGWQSSSSSASSTSA
jgi:hypothetical protein